ncbi:Acetyltransferase involved in cellulose biosynthesis, CelD/BcsL family [Sinosporangium album]|uniref:Acetyltransferase involved in cellulose biosynthesis, CelD/BcsL family n=1 Tax=Sinosporangium album TaxID=504805 RepID=A0A1G7UFJ3_9ACTN|nr:GNAT family N-acetyltransferase [Sinosporangium album]SDG45540.1 Acetyltransferase involved in cellulose biosynthesis, CelD/BcsL family [Sinosporangium album]
MGTRAESVKPGDLGPDDLALWRTWHMAGHGLDSPFLSPGFALAIARVRPHCEVAVFEDDQGIAGFLPFERHGSGVARAIGLSVSDCQGVVHRPGVRLSPADMLEAASLSVFEFDHLLAAQIPEDGRDAIRVGSPVMDLGQGYAAYRDARRALTKSAIGSVERKDRKLGREHGELRLEYGSRDPAMLRLMMTWKSAHYRRTGASDRFTWPWVKQLVEESFEQSFEETGREYGGLLSVLYAGDTPVAVEFGLRSATVYERWFGSYDADAFGQYSPGLVMLLRFAQAAAADGLTTIDLGKGGEPYKEFFASSHIPLAEGWMSRPSVRSALYRAWHAPPRAARAFVKSHPELRRRARETRDSINRVRRYGFGADR